MGDYADLQDLVCPKCGGRVFKVSDTEFICVNDNSHQFQGVGALITREEFGRRGSFQSEGESEGSIDHSEEHEGSHEEVGVQEHQENKEHLENHDKKEYLFHTGIGIIVLFVAIVWGFSTKIDKSLNSIAFVYLFLYILAGLLMYFTNIFDKMKI